ncbi:MAG: hypothetical protein ACTSW7_05375 [Candidatus Thorarchaeota archaeon]
MKADKPAITIAIVIATISVEAANSRNAIPLTIIVTKTVETLSVAGSDEPATVQEKETGSVGGIPSQ